LQVARIFVLSLIWQETVAANVAVLCDVWRKSQLDLLFFKHITLKRNERLEMGAFNLS